MYDNVEQGGINMELVISGAYVPVEEAQVKVTNELLEDYKKQIDNSKATIKTYSYCIKKFINYLDTNNITTCTYQTLLDYKNDLRMKYKPKAINTHITAIKDFFKYLESKGFKNVAKDLKKLRVDEDFSKDSLTLNQVKQILKSLNNDTLENARAYAMFYLMVTTGLRECEVTRADINDLKTKNNKIVLYVQGKGQLQKNKYVEVSSEVMEELQIYLSMRNATPGEPLFTSESDRNKGGRLSTRTIQRTIKKIFKDNGIINERITTHSTRHTAITLSVLGGASVQRAQEMARHKNINTTLIYYHDLERLNDSAESRIQKLLND